VLILTREIVYGSSIKSSEIACVLEGDPWHWALYQMVYTVNRLYSVNHHMTPMARPVNAAANVATRNSSVGSFHKTQSDTKKKLSKILLGWNLNRCKTNSGFCLCNKINDSFFKNFFFISTHVFLGFPVSISKCWDGSQHSKLPLHASHVALPT